MSQVGLKELEQEMSERLYRMVRRSGCMDVREELAELEQGVLALVEQGSLTLDLTFAAMDVFLLFRQSAPVKQIVAYAQRFFPGDPVLARIEGYLSAPAPSENDLIRASYCFKSLRYDRLYNYSHQHLRLAFARQIRRVRLESMTRIADLACGTGLVGRLMREQGYGGTLIGVDLSQEMLDIAQTTGLYTDLICEDLVTYLGRETEDFDLITAMQVVILFDLPQLDAFLAQARARLRATGVLMFNSVPLEDQGDTHATQVRLFRVGRNRLEAALKTHGLVFRFFDHDDRRYYTCLPR